MPLFMATWSIPAQFQLSKLFWIPERIAETDGLVLQKPSLLHARTFLERGRGPFQLKDLFMAEAKLEVVH